MSCPMFFDFFLPQEFTTKPRFRRNAKVAREFAVVKRRGQERRLIVSTGGEVLASDIPLYQALLRARFGSIAVAIIDCSEPADIRAAKALSAEYPLPECFRLNGRHFGHFQKYEQHMYGTNNKYGKRRRVRRITLFT